MILQRDLNYPALPLRRYCAGEVQTVTELFLATTIDLRAQSSRTITTTITVTRASDGREITCRAISSLRRRQDGTVSHRVNVTDLGGFGTMSEAVAAVLAHEAARQTQKQVAA